MFIYSRNPKTEYYEIGPLVNRTFIVEGGKGGGGGGVDHVSHWGKKLFYN